MNERIYRSLSLLSFLSRPIFPRGGGGGGPETTPPTSWLMNVNQKDGTFYVGLLYLLVG